MKIKRFKLTYWKDTLIRSNNNKTNSCIRAGSVPMNFYGNRNKKKFKKQSHRLPICVDIVDARQTGSNIETSIEYTGDINKRRDTTTNCRDKVGEERVLHRDCQRLPCDSYQLAPLPVSTL